MNQKLSIVVFGLLLSACGGDNSSSGSLPKSAPNMESKKPVDGTNITHKVSESKGILGLENLYKYMTTPRYVKFSKEIELPDVAYIMQPDFAAQHGEYVKNEFKKEYVNLDYYEDNIGAALKRQGAILSESVKFLPGKGGITLRDAQMPNSSLKAVISTNAFVYWSADDYIKNRDNGKIKETYEAVLRNSKESVMITPMWHFLAISDETPLYDIMVSSSYEAAKKSAALKVTMFVQTKDEEKFLNEAIERQSIKFALTKPSLALSGGHVTAAARRLLDEDMAIHEGFAGRTVAGASANFCGFKLLGVMTGQSQHQEHTSLMAGRQIGSFFNAIGIDLGTERRELNYSAVKAMTFFNIDQHWALSAGISAVSEKLMMPFVGAKTFNRSGVMGEIGAHFTQSFQDIKLMGDVGIRAFYSGQVQSACFWQMSLVSQAFKTSVFVSSIDAGVNWSYED